MQNAHHWLVPGSRGGRCFSLHGVFFIRAMMQCVGLYKFLSACSINLESEQMTTLLRFQERKFWRLPEVQWLQQWIWRVYPEDAWRIRGVLPPSQLLLGLCLELSVHMNVRFCFWDLHSLRFSACMYTRRTSVFFSLKIYSICRCVVAGRGRFLECWTVILTRLTSPGARRVTRVRVFMPLRTSWKHFWTGWFGVDWIWLAYLQSCCMRLS